MAKYQAIRWTLIRAASEFGVDRKTMTDRLKSAGIEAGKDDCFSTADICRAIFSDLEAEKIRDTRAAAKLKEIAIEDKLRNSIPVALVEKVWSATIIDLRQKILYAEIPDQTKQEILKDLQAIPIDEYFTATGSRGEEAAEADSEPA